MMWKEEENIVYMFRAAQEGHSEIAASGRTFENYFKAIPRSVGCGNS